MTSAPMVLVTGPPRSGVGGMIGALRERMPGVAFAEVDAIGPGQVPTAAVFVVSAVAPLTESDCTIADFVMKNTAAVLAVVSKTDDHRRWRSVLERDRELLAEHVPHGATVPWVGAAAAPRLGEPDVRAVVDALGRYLRDPDAERRNRLRANESRVDAEIARLQCDAARRQARADALRARREELVRDGRAARADRALHVRGRVHHARLELTRTARDLSATLRADLMTDIDGTDRGDALADRVRARCRDALTELDDEITARVRELNLPSEELPPLRPPSVPILPRRSRRLETQLMAVLGVGFGMGVATVVGRLLTGLGPGLPAVALTAGGAAGLAVTVWVVRARGLLHERALLERWIAEVTFAARSALEERVGTRTLAVEAALSSAVAAASERASAAVAGRLADIDAELREHARMSTREQAAADREMAALRAALGALRAGELPAAATDSVVTHR